MGVILLVNGPNLNLLGDREPEVYGTDTLEDCVADARAAALAAGHALEHVQSNHEGELIEAIQGARGRTAAIVINPGAFTHTSYAIADALAAYDGVKVELHLSNTAAREEWRRTSVVGPGGHGHRRRLRAHRVPPRGRGRDRHSGRDDGRRAMSVQLSPMDVGTRMDRVRARFDGIDALLVTRLVNVRYLTGFTGSAAMLLVRADGATFVTDGRYRDQSADQLAAAGVDADIAIGLTQAEQRDALAAAATGVARLGLEADGVTWAQQRTFAAWFPDAELVPTEGLIDGLRMVKEPGEVDRIRAACAIADDALGCAAAHAARRPDRAGLRAPPRVRDARAGASGVSFDPIVAAGPNAALPHARPSDRRIEPGELVVIDFGCVVDGYCSDMTRTVSVGEPGPDARHIWDTVLLAQRTGCEAVAVGAECAAVDRASRDVIADAGWADAFVHGTGHGVGLEIHESPRVASTSTGTLASGHVVTVEPGVYLPGVGGVRIEDTLVVTPDGPVALTEFPKQLVV